MGKEEGRAREIQRMRKKRRERQGSIEVSF